MSFLNFYWLITDKSYYWIKNRNIKYPTSKYFYLGSYTCSCKTGYSNHVPGVGCDCPTGQNYGSNLQIKLDT